MIWYGARDLRMEIVSDMLISTVRLGFEEEERREGVRKSGSQERHQLTGNIVETRPGLCGPRTPQRTFQQNDIFP